MNKINLKINPAVDDNELTKQQYLILKAELSRLEKYIQYDVKFEIIKNDKQPGLTKRIKPKWFSDERIRYNVFVDVGHLEAVTHEICHVIDRVATKQQYSKTKEFKPLLDLYKQAHKEKIKTIRASNMPADDKKRHIKFWKSPYRNGDAQSEIFARFCEYYIRERESLTFAMTKNKTTFDRLCEQVYAKNKEQMLEYFDNLFEEILNAKKDNDIDELGDEDIDEDEFLYSIETIDSEYKQLNDEGLIC